MPNFSTDLYQSNCAYNLKQLLTREHMKQNELADKLQVTPATISNYLKPKHGKLPSTEFLLRLKHHYPYINLDDFLYTRISFESLPTSEDLKDKPHVQNDIYKYYGLYNLYYLDNTYINNPKSYHIHLNSSPKLKRGLLYIYQDPSLDNNKARCIALINVSNKDNITRHRAHIMESAKQRFDNVKKDAPEGTPDSALPDLSYYLRDIQTAEMYHNELLESEKTMYRTYAGTLQMTQNHMYILLQQSLDYEEPISLILHRKYFRKDHYIGGLGSMCTVSNGHPSEPCLQMIGVSYDDLNVFDDHIKKMLRLSVPLEISSSQSMQHEEEKLKALAKSFYVPSQSATANAMYELSEADKSILFRSKLNYLLKSNAERNLLYYSKVSLQDDHDWYLLITGKTPEEAPFNEGQTNG